MSTPNQNKLATLVKRFLDLIWYLLIFAAVAWPVTVLVIGLSMPTEPQQRHADINAYLGYKIYSDVATEQSAQNSEASILLISGRGELQLNNTQSLLSWYVAAVIKEIMLFIFLYGLLQMRRLFASVIKGEHFVQENAERIKLIAFAFIGWHIIYPLLQYIGGRIMLNDIDLNLPGVQLYPAFELNVAGIFAGFALIVLAGVLREAASIHQEQSLTI